MKAAVTGDKSAQVSAVAQVSYRFPPTNSINEDECRRNLEKQPRRMPRVFDSILVCNYAMQYIPISHHSLLSFHQSMMNLGLKRPPLAQIPYKTKKFQQAGKPKRAKAPPAPSIDEISDDNDRPQLIDLDSDTESSSSRDGCRNRNGSFNYNSNSTSTDSQTNDTFIEADFPNIPHDYPPPLPALRPDLYNLTFTHKSCAGFAAVFNAAKGAMDGEANGMPTITAGYIGNSESSKMGSFAPILDNEVSEFVGDSIIGMIVALLLRKWYPHLRPDGLT